jgi:beta-lactamase regulating signal transducer with metallopeptidase domain
VWLAAWALTSIRWGSPTAKYWIWVATSLNFILPLSTLLDGFGAAHISGMTTLNVARGVGNGILRSAQVGSVLWGVWLLGALLMLARLCLRIRADRRHARTTDSGDARDPLPSHLTQGVPVRFAASWQAPAVDGVLHPHISLPDGIDRLLSKPELDAVLLHEVTHAKRGDNLIRLVHEVGLCALWFHPLVWITGSRLALYRELSCDEPVIQRAHGGHLVSALAKLAEADGPLLLQSTASSFITHRLVRLTAAPPQRITFAFNALLAAAFGAVLLAGVVGTAAQTAGSSRLTVASFAPCPADKRIVEPAGRDIRQSPRRQEEGRTGDPVSSFRSRLESPR